LNLLLGNVFGLLCGQLQASESVFPLAIKRPNYYA
jgi:hypothetical protein